MSKEQLIKDLQSFSGPYEYVQQGLLKGIPWIFNADEESFMRWRSEAGKACGVVSDHVYIVGSAKTGFSMSPRKAGNDFRPISSTGIYPSDIDIAIVDKELFESAWNTILTYDRSRKLRKVITGDSTYLTFRERIDRLRLNIYWGTLAGDHTISGTKEAQRIRSLFAATTRVPPFQGYQARARIYRRQEDLISYHVQSIESLLDSLKEEGLIK